jgi:hypothetical protein
VRRHFELPIGVSDKAGNAAVVVSDWEVNPTASESDLEPGGVLFSNSSLGDFVREGELGSKSCRVKLLWELVGSFSGLGLGELCTAALVLTGALLPLFPMPKVSAI